MRLHRQAILHWLSRRRTHSLLASTATGAHRLNQQRWSRAELHAPVLPRRAKPGANCRHHGFELSARLNKGCLERLNISARRNSGKFCISIDEVQMQGRSIGRDLTTATRPLCCPARRRSRLIESLTRDSVINHDRNLRTFPWGNWN